MLTQKKKKHLFKQYYLKHIYSRTGSSVVHLFFCFSSAIAFSFLSKLKLLLEYLHLMFSITTARSPEGESGVW